MTQGLQHCRQGFVQALCLVALLSLFTTGCATVGEDFPTEKVGLIRIGATTMQEIKTTFGTPWRTGIEDGRRAWTYGRYSYGVFAERRARDLVVRFDQDGVVASYSYSTTENSP
ncbi:MAG: outer membrane protein assembly factor BamE domain-containing protein [Porticoccaceae bacterium]